METIWSLSVDPAGATPAGSDAGVPEVGHGVHYGNQARHVTLAGSSHRAPRRTATGDYALTGRRGESESRHRIRKRVGHLTAAGGRSRLSASLLASFVVFSFLIIYHARHCLNKGLSKFSSGSSFVQSQADKTETTPSFFHSSSHGGGPRASFHTEGGKSVRRLSGETPSPLSPGSRETQGTPAQDDALCRAIEASAGARRAVAAEPLAETSDEETERGSSTQSTRREERKKARKGRKRGNDGAVRNSNRKTAKDNLLHHVLRGAPSRAGGLDHSRNLPRSHTPANEALGSHYDAANPEYAISYLSLANDVVGRLVRTSYCKGFNAPGE
ncbi:hypothetical protein CSUI_001480, partial [Cystoisospora suis]